jgi:hypothetical protein
MSPVAVDAYIVGRQLVRCFRCANRRARLPVRGSFLGNDTTPDLIAASQGETGNPIYIINGSSLTSLPPG